MAWELIACLDQLFDEFDAIAPPRDKASDGRIGDGEHAQNVSDHNPDETGNVPIHDADSKNEVHAIDVDNNLRESDLTMEKVVQFLLGRCRSGAETRLRYIIYNRRIWSASSDWVQKAYTGASPHTEHAHFSASYDTAREASRASWRLGDIPVSLTTADKTWIKDTVLEVIESQRDDIANDVSKWQIDAPAGHQPPKWPNSSMWRNAYNEAEAAHKKADEVAARLAEVDAKLDQVLILLGQTAQ